MGLAFCPAVDGGSNGNKVGLHLPQGCIVRNRSTVAHGLTDKLMMHAVTRSTFTVNESTFIV